MFAPLPFRLTRPTIAGPGENLGARRYELGRDEDRGQLRPRRTNAPWRGARGAKRGEGRRRLPDRAARGAVRDFGVNVRVLPPGQSNALYHGERNGSCGGGTTSTARPKRTTCSSAQATSRP